MSKSYPSMEGAYCPIPLPHNSKIVMGHGSGGRMSHDLITEVFYQYFGNPILSTGDDAGVVNLNTFAHNDSNSNNRIAISTDTHVVYPLFFRGGDIGKLAICGTVNDVAMVGAYPLYLSVGFILEEGLEVKILHQILQSMKEAADEAGVKVVAGDTKVVEKGKADGLFINTAGFGIIPDGLEISGRNAASGDVVILSGSIGDHGIAVLEARGDLGFETGVSSDVAPLNSLITTVLETCKNVHVMRDPTRGGLATSLNEIALQSNIGIEIYEEKIIIDQAVESACEIMGFDPLYVANEGKVIVIVDNKCSNEVLEAMHNHPYGKRANIIGKVISDPKGRVLMRTQLGTSRIVDMLSGEMLPRIC